MNWKLKLGLGFVAWAILAACAVSTGSGPASVVIDRQVDFAAAVHTNTASAPTVPNSKE